MFARISVIAVCAAGCVLAILLVAGGCSRSPLQFVEGVVTLDGELLEGATVTFRPAAEGGMTAAGITDANGRYRLNPLRGTDGTGSLAGDYGVTVVKLRLPAGEEVSDELSVRVPRGKVEYLTPQRYADIATSGLKATIGAGKNTGPDFRFDLTSDVRPR